MIYVDEREPVGEVESQFGHRKVNFKRGKDVRAAYEMMNEIGRGKFGRVMKCRRKDSGEIFAAKFVTCTRREDRRNVEREVEIMNLLKSHKLLQLFEAYDNSKSEMCLITEYIGGGELFDRVIEDEFVLSEKACCIFTKQILEGVSYIHRQQIIHLDLKPENILCLTKSGNRIKIIDFGLARRFEAMKKLQILFGTPEFVAPEVVNFEPIGYSTDMWALGVITYVLVSGLSPFMGDTDLETMANVTIAEYDYEDEAFDNVSSEAKEFIDSLLVKEQTKRATAEECLNHQWLKMLGRGVDEEDESSLSLASAKDNLNQQKTAWNNRDSNYYLFDSKSRTASQLYETELPLSITARMVEQMEVASKGQEEDQFSFFTSEGTVRRDSQLVVGTDGKIARSGSQLAPVGERKRSLEDVRPKDDTIEYIGLVKRPKTPLITAGDIRAQAQSLSERKASACGSLPDIVSSSVDATELHTSRCSLLEEDELPLESLQPPALPPLPDILTTEEEILEPPHITIEEAEEEEGGLTPLQACEPIVASPQPPFTPLPRDYTVEEGFERPEGGWEEDGVEVRSVQGNCDSDIEEDGGEGDPKSSSSSSLPSESSGIFYRAEYTPHPSHQPSPAPGLLSVENRDSYWAALLSRQQARPAGPLRKSSSGSGVDGLGTRPPLYPSHVTKSKSDAKIHYSGTDIPSSVSSHDLLGLPDAQDVEDCPDLQDICPSQNVPDMKLDLDRISAPRADLVIPRSSLRSPKTEEPDVQPWTESQGSYSPERLPSNDQLSSTISQEMQDLLSSIQSLGNTRNSTESITRRAGSRKPSPEESSLDFEQLMAEVESQIRFSTTAELLERMAACPAIEQEHGVGSLSSLGERLGPKSELAPQLPPPPSPPCSHGSSQVPDLLRAALECPPSPALSVLDTPGNRRLQRPSDMASHRPFTPTGPQTHRVPDMLSRVSSQLDIQSSNYSNFESVRDDLSKVRSDIDSLRESLCETKTDVAANSRDILARCSFYTDPESCSSERSKGTLKSDLAETSSAMREIERTVQSFNKPSSLSRNLQEPSAPQNSPNPRRIFARANQGSVTKTKDRFEQRSAESRLPVALTGPRTRNTTPFSNTRSPSPAFDSRDKKRQLSMTAPEPQQDTSLSFRGRTGTGTRLSLRRRSPSPVVTGKVSSFRSKFENSPGSSPSNNNTGTIPGRSNRPRTSPFRERISPPLSLSPSNYSLGRDSSSGRLPSHYVPLPSQAPLQSRPSLNRAQSLRTPRLSLQHPKTQPSEADRTEAASFLRSTLPRKSLPDTKTRDLQGRFGYNRI